MDVIESVWESMTGQIQALTNQMQSALANFDPNDPTLALQVQMFSQKWSIYTGALSAVIKTFGTNVEKILRNIAP